MSDDEDLYCNPQSNVFLQARFKKEPPPVKKKSGLFSRKPPPAPKPVAPVTAGDELGNLFKSGLTKPSELRKAAPIPEFHAVPKSDSEGIIDFRAGLRHVRSPIKSESENDLSEPLPAPSNDHSDPTPSKEAFSPPIPKRTSVLSANRLSYTQELQQNDEANLPPPVPITPARRPLLPPSKPPPIPIHSFPGASCDDTYLDNEIDISVDDLPGPAAAEDCEEMYTENDILPEACYDVPSPTYDSPQSRAPPHSLPPISVPSLPTHAAPIPDPIPGEYSVNEQECEDDDIYCDDVVEYPCFKQLSPAPAPLAGYHVDEELEDGEIYEDADFPIAGGVKQEEYRPEEYRPEDEEDEDIYDDLGCMDVPIPTASPLLPPASPLPPPPLLPSTLPPPAKPKKSSGFFTRFKKVKKQAEEEKAAEVSAEVGLLEQCAVAEDEEDDAMYADGVGLQEEEDYGDEDSEGIYEEQ